MNYKFSTLVFYGICIFITELVFIKMNLNWNIASRLTVLHCFLSFGNTTILQK